MRCLVERLARSSFQRLTALALVFIECSFAFISAMLFVRADTLVLAKFVFVRSLSS